MSGQQGVFFVYRGQSLPEGADRAEYQERYEQKYNESVAIFTQELAPLLPHVQNALGRISAASSEYTSALSELSQQPNIKDVKWYSGRLEPSNELLKSIKSSIAGEASTKLELKTALVNYGQAARKLLSGIRDWHKSCGDVWLTTSSFLDKNFRNDMTFLQIDAPPTHNIDPKCDGRRDRNCSWHANLFAHAASEMVEGGMVETNDGGPKASVSRHALRHSVKALDVLGIMNSVSCMDIDYAKSLEEMPRE
ncbi:MAG: hypothetical protein Q9160_000216 [Pyrenula sp. 1 TL-2023]